MKKRATILLFTLAVISVIASASTYISRSSQVSEVYLRYKDRDDLRVSFVKNYRIDDSTIVDVTTLSAGDSASWESLLKEINYPEILINVMREQKNNGNNGVGSYFCKKGYPETRIKKDMPDCELVVISPNEYCVFIFNVTSEEQAHYILSFKQSEIIHKK